MKGCQDFSKQKNQGETWKKIKHYYSYGSGAEQKKHLRRNTDLICEEIRSSGALKNKY